MSYSNSKLPLILVSIFFQNERPNFAADQQPYISIAAMSKQLTAEQLRMFLTHPSVVDPFAPNPQGANYHYHHHESPIELAIRKNALNYFKEMLQHSKVRKYWYLHVSQFLFTGSSNGSSSKISLQIQR